MSFSCLNYEYQRQTPIELFICVKNKNKSVRTGDTLKEFVNDSSDNSAMAIVSATLDRILLIAVGISMPGIQSGGETRSGAEESDGNGEIFALIMYYLQYRYGRFNPSC